MEGIINSVIFLLVNGMVLYSSYCCASYLLDKEPSWAQRVLASCVIYFVQITLVILCLGLIFKSLTPMSVMVTAVVISAGLIVYFRKHQKPLIRPATVALKDLFSTRDLFLVLMLVLGLIQAGILLMKVSILPPHIWDVFTYHLTPAIEWYQQGYIPFMIDTPVRRINSQAFGITVLSYWYFIFFKNDMWVEIPQLLWAFLLVPVTYTMLRQANVGRAWAIKFALLVFFIPIVLMQSITVKDHLALNVGFFAAVVFLVNFLRSGDYKQIIMAALTFGLVMGYKISGPLYPFMAGLLFLLFIYMNQKEQFIDKAKRTLLLKSMMIAMVFMVAIGGYWIIKNLVVFGSLEGNLTVAAEAAAANGNIGASTGAESELGGISSLADRFYLKALTDNLNNFFPRVFDYQAQYGADLAGLSGFGPQFVVFGLFAMVFTIGLLFSRRHRFEPISLYVYAAVAVLLFYFSFYYSNNNYRLFSFLPMMMIAYGGIVLYRQGLLDHKISAMAINVMMVICLVWNLLLILPPNYTNLRLLKEFVSLDAEERTSANYTRWFVVHRPNLYRLIGDIPVDEPLAYVAKEGASIKGQIADDTWTTLYYDRQWKRQLTYLDHEQYLECDQRNRCKVNPSMKKLLLMKDISLVTTCETNYCLKLQDPDFFELVPGLYYYRGGKKNV